MFNKNKTSRLSQGYGQSNPNSPPPNSPPTHENGFEIKGQNPGRRRQSEGAPGMADRTSRDMSRVVTSPKVLHGGWYCSNCGVHIVPDERKPGVARPSKLTSRSMEDIKAAGKAVETKTAGSAGSSPSMKVLGEDYDDTEEQLRASFFTLLSSIREHFAGKEEQLKEYQVDLCQRERILRANEEHFSQRIHSLRDSEESVKSKLERLGLYRTSMTSQLDARSQQLIRYEQNLRQWEERLRKLQEQKGQPRGPTDNQEAVDKYRSPSYRVNTQSPQTIQGAGGKHARPVSSYVYGDPAKEQTRFATQKDEVPRQSWVNGSQDPLRDTVNTQRYQQMYTKDTKPRSPPNQRRSMHQRQRSYEDAINGEQQNGTQPTYPNESGERTGQIPQTRPDGRPWPRDSVLETRPPQQYPSQRPYYGKQQYSQQPYNQQHPQRGYGQYPEKDQQSQAHDRPSRRPVSGIHKRSQSHDELADSREPLNKSWTGSRDTLEENRREHPKYYRRSEGNYRRDASADRAMDRSYDILNDADNTQQRRPPSAGDPDNEESRRLSVRSRIQLQRMELISGRGKLNPQRQSSGSTDDLDRSQGSSAPNQYNVYNRVNQPGYSPYERYAANAPQSLPPQHGGPPVRSSNVRHSGGPTNYLQPAVEAFNFKQSTSNIPQVEVEPVVQTKTAWPQKVQPHYEVQFMQAPRQKQEHSPQETNTDSGYTSRLSGSQGESPAQGSVNTSQPEKDPYAADPNNNAKLPNGDISYPDYARSDQTSSIQSPLSSLSLANQDGGQYLSPSTLSPSGVQESYEHFEQSLHSPGSQQSFSLMNDSRGSRRIRHVTEI